MSAAEGTSIQLTSRPHYLDNQDLGKMLRKIGKGNEQKSSHFTIFDEVLASDLPPEKKSLNRLGDEAQTVISAGLVTTA